MLLSWAHEKIMHGVKCQDYQVVTGNLLNKKYKAIFLK